MCKSTSSGLYLILVAEVSVYTTPVPNKLKLRKKPQNKWLFSPAHMAANDCLSVASVVLAPAQFLLATSFFATSNIYTPNIYTH